MGSTLKCLQETNTGDGDLDHRSYSSLISWKSSHTWYIKITYEENEGDKDKMYIEQLIRKNPKIKQFCTQAKNLKVIRSY